MQRRLRITLAVTAATGAILAGAGTAAADDLVGGLGKGLLPGSTSESSDQGTSEEDLTGDKPTKAKDGLDEDSLNGKETKGKSDEDDTSKDGKSKDNDKSKGNSSSHGSNSSGGSSSSGDK